MSSSYSPDLRIELIGTGDQAGIWGSTTNNNLAYVLEQAIAGYVSVSVTSANQALTYINGASTVAADNQSVHSALALTTTTTANFAVYAPPVSKQYTIYNASAYVATIYNSTVIGNTTAAGTGVAIPAGKTMTVWSDGTNFTQQNTHLNSPSFTTPALGTPASGTLTNCSNLPIAGITGLGAGVATFLATPSSANLASAVTDETGSGALVFATSPTLTTPALGTPSSATLTNATGLPIVAGTTGTLSVARGGTGVTGSTGTGNVVLSDNATLVAPALGTPASGTLTNATGLPIVAGTTGTLSVARGGTGVTGSTGSGNVVLSTSPSLTTPALGTPSSGNLANCTFPTLNQNTTGNAATATNPQSGGTFITSSNIGSQSVSYATTAGNGGVTSINGQTGAVTTTSFDGIGSVVTAMLLINAPAVGSSPPYYAASAYSAGVTVSGGSLAYNIYGTNYTGSGYTGTFYCTWCYCLYAAYPPSFATPYPPNGSRPSAVYQYVPKAQLSGQIDFVTSPAVGIIYYSTLSGSWRSMQSFSVMAAIDACGGGIQAYWPSALWVRYA